jgi:hypothetical protein
MVERPADVSFGDQYQAFRIRSDKSICMGPEGGGEILMSPRSSSRSGGNRRQGMVWIDDMTLEELPLPAPGPKATRAAPQRTAECGGALDGDDDLVDAPRGGYGSILLID